MKCSFCKKEIGKTKGTAFSKRDGTLFYFCSTKCRKNLFKLNRNPKLSPWVLRAGKKRAKTTGGS